MSAARGRAPGARALNGYTTCISLAGCILLLWSLREARTALPGLLLFVALGIAAELTTSEGIMPQIAFSLSSTVAYATAVGLGHLSAALVGAVGGLATTLIKAEADRREGRKRGASLARRAMFNVAALSLAPAAGGAVYVLLGGTVGGLLGVRDALPLVAGAACAELVNGVIVVGAVSLQTGQPAWRLWRQSVSWALPMNVLGLAVGGGGLAMGYRIAGVVGVAVFSLPLALTIYAFRLYVTQTKVQ
ncbi:MAG: hypothetical protein QME94_17435, partial [Anaerolineae bacterium]|nr:hypothetical protein [Anaerolineae bacterium]